MGAKVIHIRSVISRRRSDEFKKELAAAYAALHGKFTEVMIHHAARDAGVLALVRFTADVIAEVGAHKGGTVYVEELLAALGRRARKP